MINYVYDLDVEDLIGFVCVFFFFFSAFFVITGIIRAIFSNKYITKNELKS